MPDVATIEATRTFWDKVVIARGLRRWYERRGDVRQAGQRVSRHYYDLHCLMQSETGKAAVADLDLGADCVRHARMFLIGPIMTSLLPCQGASRSSRPPRWSMRSRGTTTTRHR